jgi:hypothetical protein
MDSKQTMSASALRKMPRAQRQALLAAAAAIAQKDYLTDRPLTDFEAFAEDDLYDTHGKPEPR